MAVTVKKKATAETTVEKKAKGQVLTSETKTEAVDTSYTEKATPPAETTTVLEAKALTPFCEVGFEASYTHNLGNYESCRVNVLIKIPCLHDEIDEAFDLAKSWVDERLTKVNAEIKGE